MGRSLIDRYGLSPTVRSINSSWNANVGFLCNNIISRCFGLEITLLKRTTCHVCLIIECICFIYFSYLYLIIPWQSYRISGTAQGMFQKRRVAFSLVLVYTSRDAKWYAAHISPNWTISLNKSVSLHIHSTIAVIETTEIPRNDTLCRNGNRYMVVSPYLRTGVSSMREKLDAHVSDIRSSGALTYCS